MPPASTPACSCSDEEGTASSFHGLGQTIAGYGLFASLYSDRGSHYFVTPVASGKVDKQQLTEVGRALRQLGIEHIAAYSPEARGRSERAFQTHQGRLPQELARAGITTMHAANHYLEHTYRVAHNREFAVASTLAGTAAERFMAAGRWRAAASRAYDSRAYDSPSVTTTTA